jgi:hypothetical protein
MKMNIKLCQWSVLEIVKAHIKIAYTHFSSVEGAKFQTLLKTWQWIYKEITAG